MFSTVPYRRISSSSPTMPRHWASDSKASAARCRITSLRKPPRRSSKARAGYLEYSCRMKRREKMVPALAMMRSQLWCSDRTGEFAVRFLSPLLSGLQLIDLLIFIYLFIEDWTGGQEFGKYTPFEVSRFPLSFEFIWEGVPTPRICCPAVRLRRKSFRLNKLQADRRSDSEVWLLSTLGFQLFNPFSPAPFSLSRQ